MDPRFHSRSRSGKAPGLGRLGLASSVMFHIDEGIAQHPDCRSCRMGRIEGPAVQSKGTGNPMTYLPVVTKPSGPQHTVHRGEP